MTGKEALARLSSLSGKGGQNEKGKRMEKRLLIFLAIFFAGVAVGRLLGDVFCENRRRQSGAERGDRRRVEDGENFYRRFRSGIPAHGLCG